MINLSKCVETIENMGTDKDLCFKKIGSGQYKGFRVQFVNDKIIDTDIEYESETESESDIGYTVYNSYASTLTCKVNGIPTNIPNDSFEYNVVTLGNSSQIGEYLYIQYYDMSSQELKMYEKYIAPNKSMVLEFPIEIVFHSYTDDPESESEFGNTIINSTGTTFDLYVNGDTGHLRQLASYNAMYNVRSVAVNNAGYMTFTVDGSQHTVWLDSFTFYVFPEEGKIIYINEMPR